MTTQLYDAFQEAITMVGGWPVDTGEPGSYRCDWPNGVNVTITNHPSNRVTAVIKLDRFEVTEEYEGSYDPAELAEFLQWCYAGATYAYNYLCQIFLLLTPLGLTADDPTRLYQLDTATRDGRPLTITIREGRVHLAGTAAIDATRVLNRYTTETQPRYAKPDNPIT